MVPGSDQDLHYVAKSRAIFKIVHLTQEINPLEEVLLPFHLDLFSQALAHRSFTSHLFHECNINSDNLVASENKPMYIE